MYRDDPLDDEMELREVIGDDHVDALLEARDGLGLDVMAAALDTLELLVGWAPEDEVARWFAAPQARLEARTPVAALVDGDTDEVMDAARIWAAAHA